MATTTLQIYDVPPATSDDPRPAPIKLADATVLATDDAAKKVARAMLEDQGYEVRSMNWGATVDPAKPALVAYVSKKGT